MSVIKVYIIKVETSLSKRRKKSQSTVSEDNRSQENFTPGKLKNKQIQLIKTIIE